MVDQDAAGEEIIIAKAGNPLAKLVPYQPARAARVGGQLAGQIWSAPDCWAPDEDVFAASVDSPLAAPGGGDLLAAEPPPSPYRA